MNDRDKNNCFVIMPISDPSSYEKGHFGRVYEHLIKPACEQAGLSPLRADEVKNTNFIILDILKRVVTAVIVICDLSSKNPNVLYELGVRQAFDLPVVLIKDNLTDRIFDIQGVRTIDYDESLRIDSVRRDIGILSNAILETLNKHEHDGSSLIRLLSVPRAELSPQDNLSQETSVILEAIEDMAQRLTTLEQRNLGTSRWIGTRKSMSDLVLPNGEIVDPGTTIFDTAGGNALGKLLSVEPNRIIIEDGSGDLISITPESNIYATLSMVPF
jgi:hypothetical protein